MKEISEDGFNDCIEPIEDGELAQQLTGVNVCRVIKEFTVKTDKGDQKLLIGDMVVMGPKVTVATSIVMIEAAHPEIERVFVSTIDETQIVAAFRDASPKPDLEKLN